MEILKKGTVKDPLFPNVCGIGYLGTGKFKMSINSKIVNEYQIWHNMILRCYESYQMNKQPTYHDVTVCKEWLNFQNFAEWYQENYYELIDERVELDKDIIKRGNKVYCPEYCSFVSQSINNLFTKSNKARGKYPIGVYLNKKVNKYVSRLLINNKSKHLGLFTSPIKAFNAYKIEKEKQIKIMANKYKEVLDIKVYNSLMEYKILISD